MKKPFRTRIRNSVAKGRLYIRRRVRPGWRLPLGVLLVFSGFLGFLPILGFWMIPLGIAVAAMDLRRFRNGRRARNKASKDGGSVAHSASEETRDDHTGTP